MAVETYSDFTVRNRGCVMMKLDVPEWEQICSLIAEEDVYSPDERGIEHNPHVTVLYGFHSFVLPNEVIEILREFSPPKATFGNIGIFDSHPDFDVVMITVESEDLSKMNVALAKLSHEDSFPTYRPHVTLSYVKKGSAKKYEGMSIDFPTELLLTDAIYTMPNGQKINFELNE